MKIALALLFLLEVLDGVLTRWAVTAGVVAELNPLAEGAVADGSFLLVKVLGAIACVTLLWLVHRRFPRFASVSAASVAGFYGFILLWNINILFRP